MAELKSPQEWREADRGNGKLDLPIRVHSRGANEVHLGALRHAAVAA
jgi:hypothetical protein